MFDQRITAIDFQKSSGGRRLHRKDYNDLNYFPRFSAYFYELKGTHDQVKPSFYPGVDGTVEVVAENQTTP